MMKPTALIFNYNWTWSKLHTPVPLHTYTRSGSRIQRHFPRTKEQLWYAPLSRFWSSAHSLQPSTSSFKAFHISHIIIRNAMFGWFDTAGCGYLSWHLAKREWTKADQPRTPHGTVRCSDHYSTHRDILWGLHMPCIAKSV